MFVSSKAFVLKKTQFDEKGVVLKLFTEKYGTQSFVMRNAFSAANRRLLPLFSPLSLVEIQFDDRKLNQMMYIKEVICYFHYRNIPYDIAKSSLLFFYCELLYRLLYESAADQKLYDFVERELMALDDAEQVRPDSHLRFMMQLSRILGFAPIDNYNEKECYFSIQHSSFINYRIDEEDTLPAETSLILHRLMNGDLEKPASKSTRNQLLNSLIRFFMLHNEQIRKMESVKVLAEISEGLSGL